MVLLVANNVLIMLVI